MRYQFIIFLFLLNFQFAFAQKSKANQGLRSDNYEISGVVIDESSQEPLEFATVSIFMVKDSSLVAGGITEANGSFALALKTSGPMYAEVEFIGFSGITINNISIGNSQFSYDLGIIKLNPGGISLDQVEVRAERSEMQFSLDKRIFNVGKDLASKGGSAADVLDNIPSVSVGVEGEVNLRGNTDVRILINGRPSGLLGMNGTDGLRTIQANMIDRIEVITNPSAKFEAEGMAGIINIILKKDSAKGFNGSFELSTGSPEQYGFGANLNYRQDQFNFFVNYNYQKRTGESKGNRYQEFYLIDSTAVSLQEQIRDRSGKDHSFRFGSDYFLSIHEVLTASFLYRYGTNDNLNSVIYRDKIVPNNILTDRLSISDFSNYLLREDQEMEEEPTLEYSLNYDKKFRKEGHSLKADISYQSNKETESSLFNEDLFENDILLVANILEQRSFNQESQKQWRAQLDYVRPFAGKLKVEGGLLGTFRQIKNDYLVETLVLKDWINEEGLSNKFIYNENVLGGYANLGKDFDKFSFQIGLRAEYSEIKTELIQTDEINDRDYLNFFPSGFLNYKMEGESSLQLSYSRRIRRPRFWDLNPFFTFTDPRNFFSGNPDLNPEFTNSLEFGYLKFWETGNIGTSLYYRHTTDNITRIQSQDILTQTTIRRPENIGTEDNYGLELIFAYTGIDWLRVDGSLNGFRFVTNGVSGQGEPLNVDNYTITSNLNSRISFWNNTDFQLRVNYRAPRKTVQGRTKSMTNVNLAFSKDLTTDLTLTMSLSDAFNNRKRQSIFESVDLFEESDFQWRPRTFTITVNYRINKKKDHQKREGEDSGGEGGEF